MAAPTAENIHGTADSTHDIQDETSLDVSEFKAKYTREKRERKNNFGNTRRIEYFNPMLVMSFTAFVTGSTSLAVAHPGTRVTALTNFAAERRGMDPAQGSMIFEDPEDSWSLEEDVKTSFTVMHAPFVIPAA